MKILSLKLSNINFKSQVYPADLAYKKVLQQGLRDTFQLNCSLEDLKPIAGPAEIKDIITKLRPENYVAKDDFRANFHVHTVASDGRMTSKEFLEQCNDWANQISKNARLQDGLPPFSAAITDHNAIKSVQEAVAEISQNPDKYKNFKFLVGCEFLFDGYKKPNSTFEAVGLGFNPFDSRLKGLFNGEECPNNLSDTRKVLASGGVLAFSHPITTPDKLNDDFFQFLKANGINGAEGNYQYFYATPESVEKGKKILDALMKKHNMFSTGGTDSHRKSIFSRH